MQCRPYIGVTGLMSLQEVSELSRDIPDELWRTHDLMVGVLTSSAMLNGKPNRWPGRYPTLETLVDIVGIECQHRISLIHLFTESPQSLFSDLVLAAKRCDYRHHGFQINAAWPDPAVLHDYRRHHASVVYGKAAEYEKVRVVLPVGDRTVTIPPEELAEKLLPYLEVGAISDILLDCSFGAGRLFDPKWSADCLACLSSKFPQLGIGVAGGLCASEIHRVKPLADMFSRLSIDAEGRLRDSVSDGLILQAARDYLVAGLHLFSNR